MNLFTAYIMLAVSIVTEIIATSTLPATEGFTKLKPSLISIAGYVLCFYCFGLALSNISLGVAYGTWGALGTAVTPFIGYVFYKQKTTRTGLVGIFFIILGVILLNFFD